MNDNGRIARFMLVLVAVVLVMVAAINIETSRDSIRFFYWGVAIFMASFLVPQT